MYTLFCPHVDCLGIGVEGSFQPSQLLPRLAEEYEKALEELINAAKKATELFSEVQFSCQRSSLLEPTSSSTMSASLPPDVLLAGHIYQRLVPESLQLVQRLSDKVSTSVFSPDYSVTGKPHGAKLCTFPLQQRSNNFGKSFKFFTYLNHFVASFPFIATDLICSVLCTKILRCGVCNLNIFGVNWKD